MGAVAYTDNVPDDVRQASPRFIALLGLEHWDILIRMAKKLERGTDAHIDMNTAYYQAVIKIKHGLSEKRRAEVLLHEMLHIVLWRMSTLVDTVALLAPAKDQPLIAELARQAEEQTVELLRRSLNAAGVGRID